jgi:hypothetical protein
MAPFLSFPLPVFLILYTFPSHSLSILNYQPTSPVKEAVLWIPIRINLIVLDPDPYREADPDAGALK